VRIVALALAGEAQRYIKGYPPRGAWLFLTPNLEISWLAQHTVNDDVLTYLDERVGPLEWNGNADLHVVHVGFGQEESARETALRLTRTSRPWLMFGPAVTGWADQPPEWVGCRVIGDIMNTWPEVRADATTGRLKPVYRADRTPRYHPPRHPFGHHPEMNSASQSTRFIVGCSCPAVAAPFCRDYLYYGRTRYARTHEEIVGEVVSMPRKHIRLLDEDIASEPDYYHDAFRHIWNYRRHWTVTAGPNLFRHPRLIRLLAKAGTRIVFLNEAFLNGRIDQATRDPGLVRRLYRCVKTLHARRMLVGARIMFRLHPDRQVDYEAIATVLHRIDLDFVETRFIRPADNGTWRIEPVSYRPTVGPTEPAWVKSHFCTMGRFLNRLARRPRRAGFYTTTRYLLPHSLAYRQNHLEGVPDNLET
jgi:hypothetical protein